MDTGCRAAGCYFAATDTDRYSATEAGLGEFQMKHRGLTQRSHCRAATEREVKSSNENCAELFGI